MIELNEENKLGDFEKYFGDEIEQLKKKFIEKNQAKNTIEELYQQKFKEYFLAQKDDLDLGFKKYMEAKKD